MLRCSSEVKSNILTLSPSARAYAHAAKSIRVRHAWEAKHPLGRIGTPEEIARSILFLASEDASLITGAVLAIDGGITAG